MGVTKKGHRTLSPSGSVFALQIYCQKYPFDILIPGCWEVEKRNSLSRINFNQWSDSFQTVIVRLRTQISGKLPGEVGYFHPSTVLLFFFQFFTFQVRGGTIFLCQLLNLTTADCSHSFGFLPSLLTFHRFCSCFDSTAAPVQQVFSFLFQQYRRIILCWMWNWPSSMLSVISKVTAEPRHIYGSDHPKIGLSILSRAFNVIFTLASRTRREIAFYRF